MHITVGGLVIFFGVVVLLLTIAVTVMMLFAQGMSDDPTAKFSWVPMLLGLAIAAALILIGKYSGL